MRFSILFVSLILLASCVNPTPRRPISHHSKSFFKESIERNKKVNELEEKAIKYYIAQDSVNSYLESSSGFRYRYVQKKSNSNNTPKTGDVVTYRCEISNLKNEVLYSFNSLGELIYSIDKQDIELGVQAGLKIMKKGEEVIFVFPSFNAYGLLGDKEKIGMNEPLIYRIQLIEIN